MKCNVASTAIHCKLRLNKTGFCRSRWSARTSGTSSLKSTILSAAHHVTRVVFVGDGQMVHEVERGAHFTYVVSCLDYNKTSVTAIRRVSLMCFSPFTCNARTVSNIRCQPSERWSSYFLQGLLLNWRPKSSSQCAQNRMNSCCSTSNRKLIMAFTCGCCRGMWI